MGSAERFILFGYQIIGRRQELCRGAALTQAHVGVLYERSAPSDTQATLAFRGAGSVPFLNEILQMD